MKKYIRYVFVLTTILLMSGAYSLLQAQDTLPLRIKRVALLGSRHPNMRNGTEAFQAAQSKDETIPSVKKSKIRKSSKIMKHSFIGPIVQTPNTFQEGYQSTGKTSVQSKENNSQLNRVAFALMSAFVSTALILLMAWFYMRGWEYTHIKDKILTWLSIRARIYTSNKGEKLSEENMTKYSHRKEPNMATVFNQLANSDRSDDVELDNISGNQKFGQSEFELAHTMQEIRSKYRITPAMSDQKEIPSKKQRMSKAKKLGIGVGELELVGRLAKMNNIHDIGKVS